jgi:hypothetical protein
MSGSASRFVRLFTAATFLLLAGLSLASAAFAQDAAGLRAREAAVRDQLANSPFRRPLVLESTEANGALNGDVYAVVAHPYDVVSRALPSIDHWCDILTLQFNVNGCRASSGRGGTLSITVARKAGQPVAEAHQVDFNYRVAAAGPDYLAVQLSTEFGPVGTKNYRIVLEAIPLDAKRSFLHLSYSYTYGAAARIAMKGYLATSGRDKIGFSIVGRKDDGSPIYVGGERGVIERNSMRYYLAIEAYLGTYRLPAAEQAEKRLNDWFTAIERYPRQLHEMGRDEYLSIKRKELAQRQATSVTAN